MKNGLFWRLFSAMMAVLLVTIILFTAILTSAQRNRLQDNYETEVRMQARQVAEYMQQLNNLSLVRGNATIQYLVNKKIVDIYDRYNADIWIVSFESGARAVHRPLVEHLRKHRHGGRARAAGADPGRT